MPPSWLEIVYVVVSMAFIVGLFVLGAWMIKCSFRIRRKWLCWLVRILGVLISVYILVCFNLKIAVEVNGTSSRLPMQAR